jgi:PIN domain nuclease of toxin-antitoxin system
LIWAAQDKGELSATAQDLLDSDQHAFFVSAVSAWEIATKHRIGKLAVMAGFLANFEIRTVVAGYKLLSVSCEHGLLAGGFTQAHRDPFDRLLAAQCLVDKMVLLSADKALDAFGVTRIW